MLRLSRRTYLGSLPIPVIILLLSYIHVEIKNDRERQEELGVMLVLGFVLAVSCILPSVRPEALVYILITRVFNVYKLHFPASILTIL